MTFAPEPADVRVFTEVLSDFAFLFGELRQPADLPVLEGPAHLAFMPFRGAEAGALLLGVPATLSREIAANSLGADVADPAVALKAEDAVRELASVLGGHLAEQLGPITLFPPQVLPLCLRDWDALRTHPDTRCFVVEERPVLFRIERAAEGRGR